MEPIREVIPDPYHMLFEAENMSDPDQANNPSLYLCFNQNNGFDFERICGYNQFMKEIFNRITCTVCTLIPYEPLECSNCNAIICVQCKNKWDKKGCVLRCGGEEYTQPSRILRDIIHSITLKCKNLQRGCQEQLKLDKIKVHEAECDYEEIKCPFVDCKFNSIRKEVMAHLETCEYNQVKCKFCKKVFRKSLFDSHIENDCEEVLMECPECQKSERRGNFRDKRHNCVKSLKAEIQDMQKAMNDLTESYETLKVYHEEALKTTTEERHESLENRFLSNLLIQLLKSHYEQSEEEESSQWPIGCNSMAIPFIFRFMTSSRDLQVSDIARRVYFKLLLNIDFDVPTSHQSIVSSTKRIFIVGGVYHERKTYEFDIAKKCFIERAEMRIGRRRHILTELRNGVIIATGGSSRNEEALSECEAFSISANKWADISPMNIPRFYHNAFAFRGNSIYVIGGCTIKNSSWINLNSIERLRANESLEGAWEILAVKGSEMFKPRSRLNCLWMNNEQVLLFGGIPNFNAVFFNVKKEEITRADSQYTIEGRFFFNDRCSWKEESLLISSQSTRCIFNHLRNIWETVEFTEEILEF